MTTSIIKIPIMPLREVVMFPQGIMPLFVGRDFTIKSIMRSLKNHNNRIFMVAQRDSEKETISSRSEFYSVGTVSQILQILELPHDEGLKVLFKGIHRARFTHEGTSNSKNDSRKITGLTHAYPFTEICRLDHTSYSLLKTTLQYCRNLRTINPFFIKIVEQYTDDIKSPSSTLPGNLADSICSSIKFDFRVKQDILETADGMDRLRKANSAMQSLINTLQKEYPPVRV